MSRMAARAFALIFQRDPRLRARCVRTSGAARRAFEASVAQRRASTQVDHAGNTNAVQLLIAAGRKTRRSVGAKGAMRALAH